MKYILIALYFVFPTFCFADNQVPVFVTPEDFGCINNDIKQADHNSMALQKAIDYCILHGSQLTSVASHNYYISRGLKISGYINIDFGGAEITATDPVSMLTVRWDKTEYWTGSIRNLRLNMNNIASVGINCSKVIKFHISDCEIFGIGMNSVGLNVAGGYELLVNNLHFHGSQKYSTGIRILTSDCHFSDCIMINCYTAVDNKGSNFFDRIHAWMLSQYIQGSTYFRNRSGLVFLNQCFCDTYDNAFVIDQICEIHISQLKLFHNKIMWKDDYNNISPTGFLFSEKKVANKSKIFVSDSYIGALYFENKNRQRFSNMQNRIRVFNCSIEK